MRIDDAARIVEGAADLLSRERAARGRAMADRLKFLRLLKGGEVGSVSAAARLLGYSVRQGQRWWRLYARGGGLAGLLATGRRGGSRERMTDAAWAGLDRELRAAGASPGSRTPRPTCASGTASPTVWTGSRGCSGATRSSARPAGRGTAGPRPPTRRRSKDRLGATLRERRIERLLCLDEARFGLKVRFRRRWCPFGVRPPSVHQDRYEWLWLYVAVEPVSGESVVLFLPCVDAPCFGLFLREIRRAVPAGRVGLVLDGTGSHTSRRVPWPAGLEPIALPPYSPELNPAERGFEQLRATLANRVFASLADLEAALTEALEPHWAQPDKLIRLTAYPWWREAVQHIATP